MCLAAEKKEFECPDPDVCTQHQMQKKQQAQPKEFECDQTNGRYGHRRPFWSPISCFRGWPTKSIEIKMGKINTLYCLPNQPVCLPLRSKHAWRQIPRSRFKSFAATKLIRCRHNFLKIQRLRTFSERRINQGKRRQSKCKCPQL